MRQGLLGGENKTEHGGHRQVVKKRWKTVRLGLLGGENKTEHGGHRQRSQETAEDRATRLARRREQDRLSARRVRQSQEARHARTDINRSSQQLARTSATPEATQARQQQDAAAHQCTKREQRAVNIDFSVPLFEQASVHAKIRIFHSKLAALEFHTCTSCPYNLLVAARSTECSEHSVLTPRSRNCTHQQRLK